MKPLRVTIIGALGRQGKRRIKAIQRIPDLVIKQVVDMPGTENQLSLLANELNCIYSNDWLKAVQARDSEIVIICTPNYLHAKIGFTALKAKKHVLIEKPLATTIADAHRLVMKADSEGVVLKTGFNYPFRGTCKKGLELLRQGVIGEPLAVRASIGHCQFMGVDSSSSFLDKKLSGGGVLLDLGVHMIDLGRRVLGAFQSVNAITTSGKLIKSQIEEESVIICHTQRGTIFSLHASWLDFRPYLGFRFEVLGTIGRIIITEKYVSWVKKMRKGSEREKFEIPYSDSCWVEELKEFTYAIREDHQPDGSGKDGLEALKVINASYESAKQAGNCVIIDKTLKKPISTL